MSDHGGLLSNAEQSVVGRMHSKGAAAQGQTDYERLVAAASDQIQTILSMLT
jgi:hypothetical protein